MLQTISPSAARIGDMLLAPTMGAVLSVLRDAEGVGAPGHYLVRFHVLAGPAPVGAVPVYTPSRVIDHWTLTAHETARWQRVTRPRELAASLPRVAHALAVLDAQPRPVY